MRVEQGVVPEQLWLHGYVEHALRECAANERIVAAFNARYGTSLQAPILQIIEPGRDENLNNIDPVELAAITRFSDDVTTQVSDRLQQLITKRPWEPLLEEFNKTPEMTKPNAAIDQVDVVSAASGRSSVISRGVAEALQGIDRRPMTLQDVLPLTYEWLRYLSHSMCNRECGTYTMQPTALLHEVYLKLVEKNPEIQDSAHLCGLVAQNIRWLLTDTAKARRREKRQRPTCEEQHLLSDAEFPGFESIDAIDIEIAFAALEKVAPRASTIAVCHYYLGIANPEIEAILSVSPITVSRELRFAKAWLLRFLHTQQQEKAALTASAPGLNSPAGTVIQY